MTSEEHDAYAPPTARLATEPSGDLPRVRFWIACFAAMVITPVILFVPVEDLLKLIGLAALWAGATVWVVSAHASRFGRQGLGRIVLVCAGLGIGMGVFAAFGCLVGVAVFMSVGR